MVDSSINRKKLTAERIRESQESLPASKNQIEQSKQLLEEIESHSNDLPDKQ